MKIDILNENLQIEDCILSVTSHRCNLEHVIVKPWMEEEGRGRAPERKDWIATPEWHFHQQGTMLSSSDKVPKKYCA
jgi:hypothetical protein